MSLPSLPGLTHVDSLMRQGQLASVEPDRHNGAIRAQFQNGSCDQRSAVGQLTLCFEHDLIVLRTKALSRSGILHHTADAQSASIVKLRGTPGKPCQTLASYHQECKGGTGAGGILGWHRRRTRHSSSSISPLQVKKGGGTSTCEPWEEGPQQHSQ